MPLDDEKKKGNVRYSTAFWSLNMFKKVKRCASRIFASNELISEKVNYAQRNVIRNAAAVVERYTNEGSCWHPSAKDKTFLAQNPTAVQELEKKQWAPKVQGGAHFYERDFVAASPDHNQTLDYTMLVEAMTNTNNKTIATGSLAGLPERQFDTLGFWKEQRWSAGESQGTSLNG
jgi:hypothetical protein